MRLEANSIHNLAQLRVDDHKLSITNITYIKNKSKTWFWTKSANKTDLDIEGKRNSNHEIDLKGDESSTEKVVSSEVYKVKIK